MNYWFDPKHVESVACGGDGKRMHIKLTEFLDLRTAVVGFPENYPITWKRSLNVWEGRGLWGCWRLIGGFDDILMNQTITANILDAKTIIIEIGAAPPKQELIRGEIQ